MAATSQSLTKATTTLEKWLSNKKNTLNFTLSVVIALFLPLVALGLGTFSLCLCECTFVCVWMFLLSTIFFSCVSFFDFTRISRSTRMFSQAIFSVCTFSLCVGRSFVCFVFTAWCEASWRSSSDNHCTYYVNKYAFGFLLFVYFSTFSTPSNWRFCIAFPTK